MEDARCVKAKTTEQAPDLCQPKSEEPDVKPNLRVEGVDGSEIVPSPARTNSKDSVSSAFSISSLFYIVLS